MITTPYKAKQIYLIFFIGLILASCGRNKKIDVSNINLEVKIERFDQDFDAMRTRPMAQQAIHLHNKYRVFYQDFIERILPVGNIKDTAYFKALRNVFNNKAYNDLRQDVEATYPNLDKQNTELTEAFKYIKHYYPQKKMPKVYAYFSGFQAQTSIGDGYFAIGLDLFLGANSRFYPSITSAFPHYMSRHFTPENITPRVIEGIAREDMFPEDDADKSLLSKMIYNGKIMYFMDKILPEVGDTTKISYTGAQMKWCTGFEPKIWSYFLDENLLYETDYPKIQKYLTEAPFTPGLGENNESAPKLAVWTGWQIVRTYMDKHPDVTLQQLMKEKDAQKILNESKYRPK
ncbi:gliding motility lipoprotein GldB [Mucilaginibacter sp. FT3.2]|uniref:gliding motility lipoprotein GldB n=1 Tax=Mucilaginibacter sp. FT3.2 TaxID=2723090 RepID=UPI00161D4C12|nr:gliding motility lipoprotein GldB [Mucilaginibacter sp. FT3.2]MBB6234977.1 gliding motility-associated lipoprotein GldB [Mucilaginibacter sp. FT3.2]